MTGDAPSLPGKASEGDQTEKTTLQTAEAAKKTAKYSLQDTGITDNIAYARQQAIGAQQGAVALTQSVYQETYHLFVESRDSTRRAYKTLGDALNPHCPPHRLRVLDTIE